MKPDPAYFRSVCAVLDLAPDRALFLDDREENVQAARTVGFDAEVFPAGGGRAALDGVLTGYGIVPR